MTDQMFRIMGGSRIKQVPWRVVAPHEKQAEHNHHQSLATLHSRGGLDPTEMAAVLEDRPWHMMDLEAANVVIDKHLMVYEMINERAGN